MQKRILITNDDGFESEGLIALKEALKDLAQVIIVAPSTEKSACSHSLTLTRPLRFIKIGKDFFKLDDGTPSDCVYLALHYLYKDKKPDLIISGINKGGNMGEDLTYSGTVAGAMEGVLQNVPSIAISQIYKSGNDNLTNFDYKLAKFVIKDIVKKIFENNFPLQKRRLLNINIPFEDDFKGYKVVKAGNRLYTNLAQLHKNPRGKEYFWLGTPSLDWIDDNEECDFSVIEDGFVSITPVKLDLSSYEEMQGLEKWLN